MKKNKKRLFIILGIVLFLIISSLVTLKVINYNNYKKSLKGEKLTNYVYHYTIKGKEDYYIPIEVHNDNIYYIIQDENDIYSLYRRNIRDTKEKKVSSFKEGSEYCSFIFKDVISCSNENEDYYNYQADLLYSKPYEYNRNNMVQLIYFQGKFLKLDATSIYDGDNLIKKIKFDSDDAYYTSNAIIDDNTYLIFYSSSDDIYYYYDMKNDTYTKRKEGLYLRYDKGFYTAKPDSVEAYNLITDEFKSYTDLNFSTKVFTKLLKDNYYYFMDNTTLYMVDLENKLINKVEYEFSNNISQIIYDNGLLYLLVQYNDCDVYVVDIDKADKTTYTFDEYKNKMNELVDNRVKELEDKYHIDIVYKDEVKIEDDTFEAKQMNNNYVVLDALDEIEAILKKFNTEFFDSFHDEKHKDGLIIYLTGKLTPKGDVDTTSNPAGYTLYRDNSYVIVEDIESYSLQSTTCHELMHNIEHKIWDNFPYDEWYDNNPLYFSYMYTYKTDADFSFTTSEENKNYVSFVDTYAKSWPTEDIARVFENICNKDEHSFLLDYPHLKAKALLLQETLTKYFPSLKASTVFDSLKEDTTEN